MDCPIIQVQYISGLIALINENFSSDPSAILPAVKVHYQNTLGNHCFSISSSHSYLLLLLFAGYLAYIRSRQESPDTTEKFSAIIL